MCILWDFYFSFLAKIYTFNGLLQTIGSTLSFFPISGVLSNAHGEGHNHHHPGHGDHGAHHHHDSDGSGDCELDDGLADLIKNFGLSVLGKDQESADDVQPTEDHDHINIKVTIS